MITLAIWSPKSSLIFLIQKVWYKFHYYQYLIKINCLKNKQKKKKKKKLGWESKGENNTEETPNNTEETPKWES